MLLALIMAAVAAAQPDLILHHGKIVTVDERFAVAQAVAVRGNRIVAVGDNEAVLARRGPQTRLLDLGGRTVLPGLIDAHVHALSAALSEFAEPLPQIDSFAAIQEYIRRRMAATPKGRWIVVPRTFPTRLKELRMPTREVLDVAREHPVMFDASYVVVVNSFGLKVSGINRDTPDPPGGEIVRDAAGEPNGILRNGQSLLKGLMSETGRTFTPEQKLRALEQMLQRYVAAGLTGIGDRAVTEEDIGLYRRLQAANRLPVRTVLTWRLDASRPVEDLVRQIHAAPYTPDAGDEWLKFGTFKVTLDGGMTIGTAFQRQPYGPFGRQLYGQTKPDRGQLFIQPGKLVAIFRAARDRGWQLTAHSQGGGAVDAFLDAMEALDKEKRIAPTRSHLMHASFQSREALERAARMGVLADVQAQWLYLDGPALEKVFSYDGLRYFYPLRSYLNAGVRVAAGSDHMIGYDKNRAVNPYNPFLSLWIMVTRKMRTGRALYPEECINREEALRMHTIWAAYMQFSEHERGSIEPGKLADLVVIDRDYLTCPEDQIKDIEPQIVILDGKVVAGSL